MKKDQEIEISIKTIISFLEKRNQLPQLGKIIHRLQELNKKQKVCLLISAVPLSTQEIDSARKLLAKLGETDLEIKNLVDEKIGGGIVIKISDRVLNLSLAEQINQLQERLKD